MNGFVKSTSMLTAIVALLALMAWLDGSRGGPATMLTRCNVALARSDMPPADVLLVGSSRSGVAFDPVAMEEVLGRETGQELSVDRLAIGNATMRMSQSLLDMYLNKRGAPRIIILELTFMTPRTIKYLAPFSGAKSPENYLLARDINLMSFDQLAAQPAVAMPYSESEHSLTVWQIRLRSLVSRGGALLYQFAKSPFEGWTVKSCNVSDFTREPTWDKDFSFAFGDYEIDGSLTETITRLQKEVEIGSRTRALADWQEGQAEELVYPLDIDAEYRRGEKAYLSQMVRQAQLAGAHVFVLPLPLYNYRISNDDIEALDNSLPDEVIVADIYAQIGADFSTYWYDDAHLEKHPTGALTTALLARQIQSVLEE